MAAPLRDGPASLLCRWRDDHLPRPVILWADIFRIKCEAQANLRAHGERY